MTGSCRRAPLHRGTTVPGEGRRAREPEGPSRGRRGRRSRTRGRTQGSARAGTSRCGPWRHPVGSEAVPAPGSSHCCLRTGDVAVAQPGRAWKNVTPRSTSIECRMGRDLRRCTNEDRSQSSWNCLASEPSCRIFMAGHRRDHDGDLSVRSTPLTVRSALQEPHVPGYGACGLGRPGRRDLGSIEGGGQPARHGNHDDPVSGPHTPPRRGSARSAPIPHGPPHSF